MKCMGDFGALSPESRMRLKNREPAMTKPYNPNKKENVLYYSEKIPGNVSAPRSMDMTPSIYNVIPGAKFKNKEIKTRKPIKSGREVKIVPPVRVQAKAPVKEFKRVAPTRNLTNVSPTREITRVNPYQQAAISRKAKPAKKVKPVKKVKPIRKARPVGKVKAPRIKKMKKAQTAKMNGMQGNYSMGDFGGEMGFKFKMPKIKMPRITISKKQQAQFLKPVAQISSILAPVMAASGVGIPLAAGLAAVGGAAGMAAAKAEQDIAVKKAKDEQKKIEAQMAKDLTEQQQAEVMSQAQAEADASIAKAKKKSTITAAVGFVGLAAVGAIFLLKE